MIDWIGADNAFHAVVNGQSVCGTSIGGRVTGDHPCETCVLLLFDTLATVPGFDLEPV